MNKVIKSFEKFNDDQQEAIYDLYLGGNLEKASFPFKGEIEEGVIYDDDENIYLIPASTIKASKLSTSDDNDDDDDDDVDGIEDDVEVMEDDDVLESDE